MSPQLKIVKASGTDDTAETKMVFKCTSLLKDIFDCVSVLAEEKKKVRNIHLKLDFKNTNKQKNMFSLCKISLQKRGAI